MVCTGYFFCIALFQWVIICNIYDILVQSRDISFSIEKLPRRALCFFKDLSFSPPPGFPHRTHAPLKATCQLIPTSPLYALWTTGDTTGNCNWMLVFTFKSILATLCSLPHIPFSVYASSPRFPLSVPDLSPSRSLSQYNVTSGNGYAVSIRDEWRRLKTAKRSPPEFVIRMLN